MRPQLTEALRAASVERGLDTIVLTDIARKADDPDEFDYRKIATDADLVLHVRVREMGLYSSTLSNDYVPKLDVEVLITARKSGITLLDENFHYGVNASRPAFWSVPADDRYRFASFEAVLDQVALVDEGWDVGAQALGKRIVEQIRAPAR